MRVMQNDTRLTVPGRSATPPRAVNMKETLRQPEDRLQVGGAHPPFGSFRRGRPTRAVVPSRLFCR